MPATDAMRYVGLVEIRDMVHWGLVISTVVLGIALLIGVLGVWGANGTVMWMERVAFLGVLYGTILSILVRRRDAAPPKGP